MNKGRVVSVVGAIIEAQFPRDQVPRVRSALKIEQPNITAEVSMLLEEGVVRAVALNPTDGLRRGTEVTDLEHPITVPVGPQTLGRVFNVLGETIDGKDPLIDAPRDPIRRDPPPFQRARMMKPPSHASTARGM